jgi:hypothetical protein
MSARRIVDGGQLSTWEPRYHGHNQRGHHFSSKAAIDAIRRVMPRVKDQEPGAGDLDCHREGPQAVRKAILHAA